MPSLEQRVSDLEQRLETAGEPCFWCECERDGNAASEHCTHREWNRIPHETALAELA
jgi:hypothetical protein